MNIRTFARTVVTMTAIMAFAACVPPQQQPAAPGTSGQTTGDEYEEGYYEGDGYEGDGYDGDGHYENQSYDDSDVTPEGTSASACQTTSDCGANHECCSSMCYEQGTSLWITACQMPDGNF